VIAGPKGQKNTATPLPGYVFNLDPPLYSFDCFPKRFSKRESWVAVREKNEDIRGAVATT
jgi:hypothetical protein